jgi:RHS repeat-associated protein
MSITHDRRIRVVSRTINGVRTDYVYSCWNLIEERDDSGNELAHYIYGTPTITDAAGNVLTVSGQGNRFLFTGREHIAEIGIYDYRNRVYSANLGRFLQTDPIRFQAGDINIYRYVGNSTVNGRDPSGEKINCDDLDADEKNRLEEALDNLSKNKDMKDIIDSLRNSDDDFYIHTNNDNNDQFNPSGNDVDWDSDSWLGTVDNNGNPNGGVQSPDNGLGHELDHANQHDKNPDQFNKDLHNKDENYNNKEEKRVITGSETSFANQNGEAIRTNHGGVFFY